MTLSSPLIWIISAIALIFSIVSWFVPPARRAFFCMLACGVMAIIGISQNWHLGILEVLKGNAVMSPTKEVWLGLFVAAAGGLATLFWLSMALLVLGWGRGGYVLFALVSLIALYGLVAHLGSHTVFDYYASWLSWVPNPVVWAEAPRIDQTRLGFFLSAGSVVGFIVCGLMIAFGNPGSSTVEATEDEEAEGDDPGNIEIIATKGDQKTISPPAREKTDKVTVSPAAVGATLVGGAALAGAATIASGSTTENVSKDPEPEPNPAPKPDSEVDSAPAPKPQTVAPPLLEDSPQSLSTPLAQAPISSEESGTAKVKRKSWNLENGVWGAGSAKSRKEAKTEQPAIETPIAVTSEESGTAEVKRKSWEIQNGFWAPSGKGPRLPNAESDADPNTVTAIAPKPSSSVEVSKTATVEVADAIPVALEEGGTEKVKRKSWQIQNGVWASRGKRPVESSESEKDSLDESKGSPGISTPALAAPAVPTPAVSAPAQQRDKAEFLLSQSRERNLSRQRHAAAKESLKTLSPVDVDLKSGPTSILSSDLIRKLTEELNDAGIEASFYDPPVARIPSVSELEEAEFVFALLTKDTASVLDQTLDIAREIGHASKIVPLLLEPCNLSPAISNAKPIDFTGFENPNRREAAICRLKAAIGI